jgi:hypothetical protein
VAPLAKNPRRKPAEKENDYEPTEEEVRVPLSTLVVNKRTPVQIWDMGDYGDIFYAIENTALQVWLENPALRDHDVLSAYASLLKDFDHQPDDSLASEIAMAVKAFLLLRRHNKQKMYTYGEITSCLSKLVTIAKDHRSPDGKGYLKWVRTFLEGNMPTTLNDILEYMFKNEM